MKVGKTRPIQHHGVKNIKLGKPYMNFKNLNSFKLKISIFQCLRVDMFSNKPVQLGGGIKLSTSLSYNPDLERLTLAVFQCQVDLYTYIIYLYFVYIHNCLVVN